MLAPAGLSAANYSAATFASVLLALRCDYAAVASLPLAAVTLPAPVQAAVAALAAGQAAANAAVSCPRSSRRRRRRDLRADVGAPAPRAAQAQGPLTQLPAIVVQLASLSGGSAGLVSLFDNVTAAGVGVLSFPTVFLLWASANGLTTPVWLATYGAAFAQTAPPAFAFGLSSFSVTFTPPATPSGSGSAAATPAATPAGLSSSTILAISLGSSFGALVLAVVIVVTVFCVLLRRRRRDDGWEEAAGATSGKGTDAKAALTPLVVDGASSPAAPIASPGGRATTAGAAAVGEGLPSPLDRKSVV